MMDFLILAGEILANGLTVAIMLASCVAIYAVESNSVAEEV